MLPRRHRLTRPEDFRAVLRGGAGERRRARVGSDLLVVHAARPHDPSTTPAHPPRVGFVVSKAVGNSVVRHRVVRRLRALMAPRLDQLPAGTDLVIRASAAAAQATSEGLGRALDRALDRLGLGNAGASTGLQAGPGVF